MRFMMLIIEHFINTLEEQMTELVRQAYNEGSFDAKQQPKSFSSHLWRESSAKKNLELLFAFNESKDGGSK